MNTYSFAVIAIGQSLLPLLVLALRDPKRLRSLRLPQSGASNALRRLLAALLLLPGIVLIFVGQWPAFLIWLGGLVVGGWLLVLALARQP